MFRISRILYPTDFSSYSNQAYFHAVALAETHGAALTIMYVFKPGSDGDKSYWRGQLEQIRPSNQKIPVDHVLLEGEPAEVIGRYVADKGIDMVVMGTHGRTGQERLLMGSVAEQTLRTAPCSVLVVKLPKRQPSEVQPDVQFVNTSG